MGEVDICDQPINLKMAEICRFVRIQGERHQFLRFTLVKGYEGAMDILTRTFFKVCFFSRHPFFRSKNFQQCPTSKMPLVVGSPLKLNLG